MQRNVISIFSNVLSKAIRIETQQNNLTGNGTLIYKELFENVSVVELDS